MQHTKLSTFKFSYRFFVSDVIIEVGFRPFWISLPDPGPKLPDGGISLLKVSIGK